MAQRVRSIHGQFITVEEKAVEDAAIAAKFGWKAPDVICADIPGHPGKRLVSLRDPEDLEKFAKYMNHCANTHLKWVTAEKIWAFLTVLDQRGEPHGTIHLKDEEWLNKVHPADTPGFRPTVYKADGHIDYTKTWVTSRAYDLSARAVKQCQLGPNPLSCGKSVMFEGKPHVVLSVQNRYGGTGETAIAPLVAWIEANLVK